MSSPEKIWREAILPINATIGDAIRNLDKVSIKIVMVVNKSGVLQGTISDGDIRRGLLKGLNLDSPVTTVIHANPLVVMPDLERDLVMQLMTANNIQQIPIVNSQRNILGLHLWGDIASLPLRPNLMVIMAGGKGMRLRPHTENCPKPMLTVAGKPILEHIIQRAKSEGFTRFIIATHYLGHMIKEYFGDGDSFGIQINYLCENSPLGTAGALSLLKPLPDFPFIVTNGDVITDIRYGELLDFHCRNSAMATMAVRLHEWRNPFGVVQIEGNVITGFEEKPVSRSHINAGVYAIEPGAINYLNFDEYCDMPTLFERLQNELKLTVAYPMHEPWLDVGRPDDLKQANAW